MLIDVSRCILVFAHLMFFSGAIALVLWTDYSIIRNGVRAQLLEALSNRVVALLVLLWLTGITIVFIDTGFHITQITNNSKLLLKLVCVLVLTFNGVLLHMVGLKLLTGNNRLSGLQAILLSIVGAVSISNWFLAAFIGSANMLTQFPFQILLLQYGGIVLIACLCGCFLSGFVRKRLNSFRECAELDGQDKKSEPNPTPTKIFMPDYSIG